MCRGDEQNYTSITYVQSSVKPYSRFSHDPCYADYQNKSIKVLLYDDDFTKAYSIYNEDQSGRSCFWTVIFSLYTSAMVLSMCCCICGEYYLFLCLKLNLQCI